MGAATTLGPKPLEINHLGRAGGGQSLGFGERGARERAARGEGGKPGEGNRQGVERWEGSRDS